MIPGAFEYQRADSVDAALQLAADGGEDARFLAGGHSLLPLMKLRLADPKILIDVSRISELNYIRQDDGHLAVGALTTYDDIARSQLLASVLPLLAHAASQVGDPQVRHCGTIGGSLAHADPAADLPAVTLALDATLVTHGPSGRREIAASDFFLGLFETALEQGELLTEVRIPRPSDAGWSFQKFTKRAIDWAIVGVVAQSDQVALINMGGTPLRATAVEQALAAGASVDEAARHAAEGTSPSEDLNGPRAYREHLARVLVARALAESRSRS
jgi:carbon-monoxide dehydrogenase medium subunit